MQPGSRIAHFEVLGLIGSGRMGQVYRAHNARPGRDVAIKKSGGSFRQSTLTRRAPSSSFVQSLMDEQEAHT
jgi:serine/threonine protein kinase